MNHIALSTCKPTKRKCGDASFSGELLINNEQLILLLVADGVSSAPKDWLASQSVVVFLVEFFNKQKKISFEIVEKAISSANNFLLGGVENTWGMLTTLSLALYFPERNEIWWSNIGDSRIYGLNENEWRQISTDDSTTSIYKEKGQVKLQNGMPLTKSLITKAIGQAANLDVKINVLSTKNYTAFILSSDGFYELNKFINYVTNLNQSADLNRESFFIQKIFKEEIKDDASFALLRLPHQNKFNLRAFLFDDIGEISPVKALDVIDTEIRQAVIVKDYEYIEKIILLMNKRNIFYSKNKMIEILEFFIDQKNPFSQKIALMIRKL